MAASIVQEFYKFKKQSIPYYGLAALLILMLYSFVSGGTSRNMVIQGFGMGQWTMIILITIAVSFFNMEYQNGTIVTLFYKNLYKSNVFFAKFLVIISYGLALLIAGFAFTCILQVCLSQNKYHFIGDLWLNTLGCGIYLLFIMSFSVLMILLFKSNALVIGIGLMIGFLGFNLSSAIMYTIPQLTDVLKWNPLNMISVMGQLTNPSFLKASHLSNYQLLAGNIVYTTIFMLCSYIIFRKKRV